MLTKAIAACASALMSSAIASIPADPESLDAVAKWPLTVILGAVCCFVVWLMYKQGKDFAKAAVAAAQDTAKRMAESASESAKAIDALVAELKQRPCIRDPNND